MVEDFDLPFRKERRKNALQIKAFLFGQSGFLEVERKLEISRGGHDLPLADGSRKQEIDGLIKINPDFLVVALGLKDDELDFFGNRFTFGGIFQRVDPQTKRRERFPEGGIGVFFSERKEFLLGFLGCGNGSFGFGFDGNPSSFDVHGRVRKRISDSIGPIEKISNPCAFAYRIGMKRNYVKIGVDEAGR